MKDQALCVEPTFLKPGELVACRYCWQCRANRVNDLVGRCIAEQETSSQTLAVTLTYAGDAEGSAVLVYADFQRFMKRLRFEGYQVRYIVAGEYGSHKGRAHWHAVLFLQGRQLEIIPQGEKRSPWQITLDERINWKPWPHGFAFFQQPDYGGFAYVLKYALKDLSQQVHKGHLAMSKKPPLGASFFDDLAARYVAQRLAPQDLFYSFGHIFDADRKRRRFLMQGVTRENFLRAYLDRWETEVGTPAPVSELLTEHWDKLAREELDAERTDAEWLAAKSQWPKYQSPASSQHDWEFDLFRRYHADPTSWQVETRPLPLHFFQSAPLDLVEAALADPSPPLKVFDPDGGDIIVFYTLDEKERSWRVSGDTADEFRDWLNSL